MSRIVQQVRMGSVASAAYIGAPGQITMDTDSNDLFIHDGVTLGGWRLPNENNIAGFSVRAFTAVRTESVPGLMTAANVNTKHVDFTVLGTYSLPALADIGNIGDVIELQAQVPGVIVDIQGTDRMLDQGIQVSSISLTQYEVVRISKKTTTRYLINSRY